ncbi:MAG: DNA-binding protein [Bacteroidales bacterium]|nr:DNA-binding protein [Bacteroidales bacterium]
MASIKYKIYKNSSSAGVKDKYYARAFHDETICLEELAEHMSSHNTPYSKGTIHGVLKDMVSCVRELLLDSKKVKLDDLAIFSLGLQSKPADSPSEFTPSGNIVKAYINALGTGEISKRQLDITARFKEVGEYSRGDDMATAGE